MKIEAGKFYRTRSGAKAFVVAIRGGEYINMPCVGYICNGLSNCLCWTRDGKVDCRMDMPDDLVAEWSEPVTREVLMFCCGDDYRAVDANWSSGFGGWKLVGRGTITAGDGMD